MMGEDAWLSKLIRPLWEFSPCWPWVLCSRPEAAAAGRTSRVRPTEEVPSSTRRKLRRGRENLPQLTRQPSMPVFGPNLGACITICAVRPAMSNLREYLHKKGSADDRRGEGWISEMTCWPGGSPRHGSEAPAAFQRRLAPRLCASAPRDLAVPPPTTRRRKLRHRTDTGRR